MNNYESKLHISLAKIDEITLEEVECFSDVIKYPRKSSLTYKAYLLKKHLEPSTVFNPNSLTSSVPIVKEIKYHTGHIVKFMPRMLHTEISFFNNFSDSYIQENVFPYLVNNHNYFFHQPCNDRLRTVFQRIYTNSDNKLDHMILEDCLSYIEKIQQPLAREKPLSFVEDCLKDYKLKENLYSSILNRLPELKLRML